MYILIVVYANFLFMFITSLVLYSRRKNGSTDPKFDGYGWLLVRDTLFKILPKQRPIEDLIPDLATEAFAVVPKDDADDKKGNGEEHHLHFAHHHDGLKSAAQLQHEEHLWKVGIQRKNELIDQDCKYILDRVIPGKMKAPFQSLIASQKGMVQNFQNNEKGMVQSKMDEQSALIKELLG
jgi:hypothetical protein